jgi:hypothetical protein
VLDVDDSRPRTTTKLTLVSETFLDKFLASKILWRRKLPVCHELEAGATTCRTRRSSDETLILTTKAERILDVGFGFFV